MPDIICYVCNSCGYVLLRSQKVEEKRARERGQAREHGHVDAERLGA